MQSATARHTNALLTLIKLITYVIVSLLIITRFDSNGVEILIVLITLIIMNSFFRQEYLVSVSL